MKIYRGKLKRRKMHRRIKICGAVLGAMFLVVGVRLGFLCLDADTATAAKETSRWALELYTHRNAIYDRNFLPLTNGQEYYICVSPSPKSYTTLSTFLGGDTLTAALEKLRENKPLYIRSDAPLTGPGLTLVRREKRYGLADHVIGYVDSSGHGVSGIERDFDSLLYTGRTATVHYTVDARGGTLGGLAPTVTLPDNQTSGVVLTIDRSIQQICEKAMTSVEAGAAVVMDVQSGDILAMVSRPDFDIENLSEALNAANAPLLNRCLTNYNVGSVFKPLVAATALESGFDDTFTVNCTGSLEIGGHTFACHEEKGHGTVDFKTAVAKSCNVFFYSLSGQVNGTDTLSLTKKMGFANPLNLTDSIVVPAGNLPYKSDLTAPAAAANFFIGQGALMLSPVHIASLYTMLAGDGEYIPPRLIKGVFHDRYTPYPESTAVPILSKSTAKKVKGYLLNTVNSGTGRTAKPENTTAAGKTATAETGWIKDGQPVDQAWFAGYFPAEDPQYVVVILKENGTSGAVDCAPIFKEIADGITVR